jgi:acetyltransferase
MGELTSLFKPNSIAVVGASKTPGKIGHSVLANIINSGYQGELYPINPRETEILGHKCYPSIASLAGKVDVAAIAVPPATLMEVAQQCGEAGVRFLIVITAGFKESGPAGAQREIELVEMCRRYGMRMVGPNCLGLMDSHTPYNASFSKDSPLRGQIAFLSQSGALCLAILDWSFAEGLGFSKFISLGNKADLTEADFIFDAAQDDHSRVVLAYLEDVVDGKRFLDIVGNASRKIPVVILKSGVSQSGAEAASSHTGALAGSDRAYDLAFRQSGVVRARTMEELFDLAMVFTTQPLPRGPRVAIVTNSGGPGIVTTDAVENAGLTMARFTPETIESLRPGLPVTANLYNPVDVIGDADWRRYAYAIERVLDDPSVDILTVLLTPTAVIDIPELARFLIGQRAKHPAKPIVTSFIGGKSIHEAARLLSEGGIPNYVFPERAIAAVRGLVQYADAIKQPHYMGTTEAPGKDSAKVRAIFDSVRADGRRVLLGYESAAVAGAYGIPVPVLKLAKTADEAVALANEAGYPVVLKVASPQILHKTDVGGIKVGVKTPEEVRQVFAAIMDSVAAKAPDAKVYGLEVQNMLPSGRECIIGLSMDPTFGAMIMFGMGGIYVNLIQDVSFRLVTGLTRDEAHKMITETKAYTLLQGFRGEEPGDIEGTVDTICRIAALVRDFPEISELDVNPLFVYNDSVVALDCKITLGEQKA